LIFAPAGRDAAVAGGLLDEAGITWRACPDIATFERALGEDVLFAVVTEEAMRSADLRHIKAWVDAQPSWSDLLFIILTRRGGGLERNPDARRLSDALGNVSFLERPFHPTTFVSVARTTIKGRHRQFDARASLAELHESEQRLRTALLAGRLGSWELDLATLGLRASATYKAVFGRRPDDELTYRDVLAAIHGSDRTRVESAIETSLAGDRDFAIEFRILWPDATVHWAEMHARPVRNHRGGARLVGVSSDITERKTTERALRHLNETLEARVLDRTAQLERAHAKVLDEIAQRERTEELLRQSQKMEMIGQLTGGVAHDFNNLLMAVMGNLDILRKHLPDDPKASRLIDGALQGARRGAALTQRLLAFARRQDLRIEAKSLTDLILGMTDLLERSVGPQIELRIDLPATLPLALLDANQVELALLNLVVNARDAMPNGGSLVIALDQVQSRDDGEIPAGTYIRLSVSDTGIGMDSETLKKAIEPFFSTKELGKGTGLGLSMIQGLAVQLKGALRLASQPGVGTRAELWLPATADNAGMGRTIAAPEVGPDTTIEKKRILVVDDDLLIAMSTVDMLEDLGHEVAEANSGARALEILQSGREFDLLITDYSMPRMTGGQLAKAAQKIRPGLPILLATGYAELPQDFDIDLPRLSKPYQQDQLAAEIAKLLRSRST
jgi:PAS domain S-box-containing protein